MYGLQIKNGEEVNEISEYIGNLSGFDGQNFNPVVTTEPLSGYGLSLNNEKIILHNDDTYVLREIRRSNDFDWNLVFKDPVPDDRLVLGQIVGNSLRVCALDRISSDSKKGKYGLHSDSRTFAPIQKPSSIRALPVIITERQEGWWVLNIKFAESINGKFLSYSDLKEFSKDALDIMFFDESRELTLVYLHNFEIIDSGRYKNMPIHEYTGIR